MKSSRLKAEREGRGWSQAKIAEVLGIHSETVSRWERGVALPQPYYRERLSDLFGKTIEELGLLADAQE
ncbi:MAG TPA: helix-turn-helix transcriptional regulator, partial [Ktedonobacteraceae bacterium]|nr:helix-turn-helix transcriptional regulator [Ktedonobacteraceae bacterium]